MILSDRERAEYTKLYRKMLRMSEKDRELAHARAWEYDFRRRLILAHSTGWWTVETKAQVIAEIEAIEAGIKW